MSTDTTVTDPTRVVSELELLHRLVGRKLDAGQRRQPLDECLCEFRRYLESVERLRDEICPGLERSLRGEYGKELAVKDIARRVRERLAESGIG